MSLAARWAALFPAPVAATTVTAVGDELAGRWSEPHRRYHTVAHLTRMLDVIDQHESYADDPAAVKLAAWFHDAVYDPARPDNEARSADLARERLRDLHVPDDVSAEVVRLIELTATHDVSPSDRNGALIVDADLAILATPPETYAEYARQVRDEYAFVPDADFRRGRAEILRRFLDRPAIYRMPVTHATSEATARANLSAEINALAGADPTG